MEQDDLELADLEDDGLITPEIKIHTLEKYRIIHYFLKIFSTSMKDKWKNRVYIDLFAAAGRSRVEGNNRIVFGSPLLALDVKDEFDKYIFCEKEKDLCDALNERVGKMCEGSKFKIIEGDVNENTNLILNEIPKFGPGNTCLSFCLVDPKGLRNIKFQTIEVLASKLLVDFLVLIPTNIDVGRNESLYVEETEETINDYLDEPDWREQWASAKATKSFRVFVLEYFCKKMEKLKYIHTNLEDTVPIRFKSKNFTLYHLAYFSRHKLGHEFWKEAKKNANPQTELNF